MSKKFSAARKRAFLQYLAETGNQTLSAERAKVSRSWVCLQRSGDSGFDAACREAIREAKTALRSFGTLRTGEAQGERLGDKWKYHDGAELVVSGSNGRRVQVRRARLKQWTPRVEQRFLAALGASCNVKATCAAAGMWPPSAYNHRKRWPAFARAWDAAIEEGEMRLEMALLERGGNLFADPELPEPNPIGEMTAADAIALLKLRRGLARSGKWARWKWRPRTLDEVRDSILKKLEAVAAYRELEEREREK